MTNEKASAEAKRIVELYRVHAYPPNPDAEDYLEVETRIAKSCAIIHVQGIIGAIDFDWMEVQNLDRQHNYWQQVIEEIQKL